MKAIIKRVSKGRHKGEFRFVLIAENGEPVAQSHPETYTRKEKAIQTLNSLFPQFIIEDKTK